MFIKEAEQWAIEWDNKAKTPGFVKPAFFGVPISLKECTPLAGYDQTRGFVQDVGNVTKIDSVLVQQIKMLGMVPFVQTNVPQSLLNYSCSNPVYGTTNNPLDKDRTPGGSSGGESAIIGAGGSIIGIGGDVGGSIRIPCHFTGTAGIKHQLPGYFSGQQTFLQPSHLRFSHRGVCGSVPGRPLINSSDGPMARDIETIVDFLREIWRDDFTSQQDPFVPPVLWNEDLYKEGKKYRIGYYIDDGWFTPIPAIQRAVLEAKSHLEAAGHTLVPFSPPGVPRIMRNFVRAVCVDGGKFLMRRLLNVHYCMDIEESELTQKSKC
ncbi:Amidase [Oesophagostomum dentatum]|uniref:Amidase n=1 Tax=Oesophagostomum dentatum TaxID=61180 RepID=A0A0B1T1Z8_OESDE|nr:Amidase [Oesophagostomum dentatum]